MGVQLNSILCVDSGRASPGTASIRLDRPGFAQSLERPGSWTHPYSTSPGRCRDNWLGGLRMMSSRRVIFSVPFVFTAQMAWAIGGCPDYPLPNPTETIAQYVSRNGNACVLGSYLKLNATYNADFVTLITGGCARYLGTPPSCPYYDTQYRYIGASSIWETGASGLVTVYPYPSWPAPSALDTRQLNTSTPDTPQWQFNNEGERELISGSNISLNCGSPVVWVQTAKTYNVTKCEPIFYKR